MLLGELECLAQAREHAEPEHVDLEDAERVEIVLVPFDEGAVLHRAIADRHHLVEPAAGDDEAADVLGQMARKAIESPWRAPRIFCMRGLFTSMPARASSVVRTAPPPMPQIEEESAPIVSSDSPKALPTSRMAERPR